MYPHQCPPRQPALTTHNAGTIPRHDRVCTTEVRSAERIAGYAVPDAERSPGGFSPLNRGRRSEDSCGCPSVSQAIPCGQVTQTAGLLPATPVISPPVSPVIDPNDNCIGADTGLLHDINNAWEPSRHPGVRITTGSCGSSHSSRRRLRSAWSASRGNAGSSTAATGNWQRLPRKAKEEEPLLAHERAPGDSRGPDRASWMYPGRGRPLAGIPFAEGPGLPERASSPPAIP